MNDTLFQLLKQKKQKEFYKLVDNSKPKQDLNIRDKTGNYLLNYAVIYNDIELVVYLLENGTSLDIVDTDKKSILYTAIKFDHIEIFKILLEYNKKNIGLDILNIQDNDGHTALFYAVRHRRYDMFELLIENTTTFNNFHNKNGLFLIHNAVLANDPIILKSIINHNLGIDKTTSTTGYTALHFAVIYNLKSLVLLLLKNGANMDIQDYNGATPLHYAIYKNTTIQDLITYGADINKQDFNGDTSVHYLLKHSMFEYIPLIINKIKPNIANRYHTTILHMILQLIIDDKNAINDEHLTNLLDKMLLTSNINFQDYLGFTPLHLLFMTDLWKDKLEMMKDKQINMNILISNKAQEYPISNLSETDKEFVIEYIADKYINMLKNNDYKLLQDVCFSDKSSQFIKLLNNYYGLINWNITTSNINCKQILISFFKYIFKNPNASLLCPPKSYPSNLLKQCPKLIITTNDVDVCRYTGLLIDVLSGVAHLVQNYKNVIYPCSNNLNYNPEREKYFQNQKTLTNIHHLHNTGILWMNKIIIYPHQFDKNLKNAIDISKQNNIDFIIIPLNIHVDNNGHANYIIIQHSTKSIERFETHGGVSIFGLDYEPELLDNILESKFSYYFKNYKYVTPKENFTGHGFQTFDSHFIDTVIGDPGGFCGLWALYYTEMRLKNSNMSSTSIVKLIFHAIKSYRFPFTKVIRNYSENIVRIRDKVLRSVGTNINNILSDNYTQNESDKIAIMFLHLLKK